jgi:hypothetical protein
MLEIQTYATYIEIKEGMSINHIPIAQIETVRKEGSKIISIQLDKRSNYIINYDDITLFNSSSTIPTIVEILNILTAIISTGGTEQSTGTFEDADLVADVLSVNHGLGFLYPTLKIEDPTGQVSVKDYSSVDVDNLEATFAGGVGAGTYKWICVK